MNMVVWCVLKVNHVFRSNLVEGIDSVYISKCLYDPEDAPLCPIFQLGDIVKLSGFNFETIARVVNMSLSVLNAVLGQSLHVNMMCFIVS